jgi:hypothetical protein
MQENLDVLISFVVVIIALSMLLQIIVEAFKNFFRLRWYTYELFFKEVYLKYLVNQPVGKSGISTGDQQGWLRTILDVFTKRKDREKLGAVRDRLLNFGSSVSDLSKELIKVKKLLLETKLSLELKEDDEIRDMVISLPEKIGVPLSNIKAMDLNDLFRIYFQVVKKYHSALGPQINIDNIEKASKLFEKFDKVITKLPDEIDIKKAAIDCIDEILNGIAEIEAFIASYKIKIVDKIDSLLADLENMYARSISTWAFFIGLIMVTLLNADTILIYKTLKIDTVVRAGIMEQSKMLTEDIKMSSGAESINDLTINANKIKATLKNGKKIELKKYESFLNELEALNKAVSENTEAFNKNRKKDFKINLPYDLSETTDYLKNEKDKITNAAKWTNEKIKEMGDHLDKACLRMTQNNFAFMAGILKSQKDLIFSTDLPMGWGRNLQRLKDLNSDFMNYISKVIGLLVTAILISFGAPFWNEVLKSLLGLRNFLNKSKPASLDITKTQG